MKVFIVYWHPEPLSFNASMFLAARDTFLQAGHEVRTSDLHAMAFDPVSSRKNFSTIKDPSFLKPQAEEAYATEMHGFSEEIEAELQKLTGLLKPEGIYSCLMIYGRYQAVKTFPCLRRESCLAG